MKMLSNKEFEELSSSEKIKYYQKLKEDCISIKDSQFDIGQELIHKVYPIIRGYKLEIEGLENIPRDSNVLFVVNHSNSHDIFTAYEVLSMLNRKGSVMVATDCLNPITTGIFNISNATLLDRRNKEERQKSIYKISNKILRGRDGVVFGESTWNIHPTKVMHNIHQGSSKIAAITQVPIIPTIFEYIEKNDILSDEKKLYRKCIIRFGKPVEVEYTDNPINQSNIIKNELISIRKGIWSEYNINRENISSIDPNLYVNHTYLKKFKAFGFTYDSKQEQEYLLFLNDEKKENEYCISDNGELIPGITEKNKKLRRKIY